MPQWTLAPAIALIDFHRHMPLVGEALLAAMLASARGVEAGSVSDGAQGLGLPRKGRSADPFGSALLSSSCNSEPAGRSAYGAVPAWGAGGLVGATAARLWGAGWWRGEMPAAASAERSNSSA